MKVEEFKNLTEDDLRQRANACLAVLDNVWQSDAHAAKLLQAQLYMNEINRRNDEKIATRDGQMAERSYKMEIAVIVLIGHEIVIGIGGVIFGVREGNQQATILNDMKASTAAKRTATCVSGEAI
jgi:hypothetical protein